MVSFSDVFLILMLTVCIHFSYCWSERVLGWGLNRGKIFKQLYHGSEIFDKIQRNYSMEQSS